VSGAVAEQGLGASHKGAAREGAGRLGSLDAFRGLVIVVMFLVNVAGRDPAFPAWFPHMGWNNGQMGLGLADYVFPWFLFIVGAAVPLSMASGRGRDKPAWRKAVSALRRGAVIYLLGTVIWCATIAYDRPLTLSVFAHWDILPLIGFAYAVCVLLYLLPAWVRVAFVLSVLVYKWMILTQLRIPGEIVPVWTQSQSYQAYLRNHLGWWGTAVTQGLPSAATVMLGAMACGVLRANRDRPGRVLALLGGGGAAMALTGWAWHVWGDMPLSKDFFTSSYVLVSAGTGAMLLALMYLVIDAWGWTSMWFLRVLGMNALAAYILAEFLWKTVMMRWKVVTPGGGSSVFITAWKGWIQHLVGSPTLGSWVHVATYILAYWLVCWMLYRKGWFVKV
jgi:predicted acyltransferase